MASGRLCTGVSAWCHTGVWERVFDTLCADSDNKYLMLDSTIAGLPKTRSAKILRRILRKIAEDKFSALGAPA